MRRNPTPRKQPQPSKKQIAYQKLNLELERAMPRLPWSTPLYECKTCGAAVKNRITHRQWHMRSSGMFEVLTSLFGEGDSSAE